MKRERTIGSNPLDTIATSNAGATTAEDAAPAHARAAGGDATASSSADAPAAGKAGFAGTMAAGAKTTVKRLRTPEIVVLNGDLPPQDTRISYDADGHRGFRLGEEQFVAIARDVERIDICPHHAPSGVGRLLFWGALGAFVAGPIGALAGGVLGGRKLHRVTAQLHLKDGRTLTVVTGMSAIERMRKDIDIARVA
jgi:hypothetical protein